MVPHRLPNPQEKTILPRRYTVYVGGDRRRWCVALPSHIRIPDDCIACRILAACCVCCGALWTPGADFKCASCRVSLTCRPPLQLCSMFGLPHTPAWLGWVQENKFKVLFAAFIASNFASRLTSTGAFEVIVDGMVAYLCCGAGCLYCISCVVRVVCACVGECVFASIAACLRVCAFVEPLCAHRTLAGDTVFSKLEMGRLPTFEVRRLV